MNQSLLICSLILVLLLPVNHSSVWQVKQQALQLVETSFDLHSARQVIPLMRSDLNQDGAEECLHLQNGIASVVNCRDGNILWQSPSTWQVREAQITDLNRDGIPEVTLLVWRPFKPWPIEQNDPSGGRIKDFHDSANQSCHVILIHWSHGTFRELWAGSALVRPVSQLTVGDVDGDGWQELVALEGYYDSPLMGGSLTVWRWQGFGFVLQAEVNKFSRSVHLLEENDQVWIETK
jgi:hypothetical protein